MKRQAAQTLANLLMLSASVLMTAATIVFAAWLTFDVMELEGKLAISALLAGSAVAIGLFALFLDRKFGLREALDEDGA